MPARFFLIPYHLQAICLGFALTIQSHLLDNLLEPNLEANQIKNRLITLNDYIFKFNLLNSSFSSSVNLEDISDIFSWVSLNSFIILFHSTFLLF